MNRRTLLLGVSALGIAAFAGGAYVLNQRRTAEAEAAAAATPAAETVLLIRPHSPVLGPADAPVTLVEFFDPSCEACRAFHPVVQEIRRQFPTQVRVVMRYTVFHQGSDEAVRILEVARMQDKFEQVLDAILEKQPTWALHDGPQMDVAWRVAGAVGLDLKKSETERLFPGITGVLNQDAADVEALGIRQTPTFFLNGQRLENVSAESLIADVKLAVESP
ncbi:MAG: thioredoxin domain-containing protein [Cypionkella sp.]|jgi:protein-disulfide isomerase|uniref:DsbA family protein n=1 Tax=Cypionkella sp. TaxID=2811411 RepID=UPI00275CBDA5|nr:thioredoxin domain-containing protein [Cypionkella sp.]MDP1577819.1 thioredoxin domain-containing protein [Cypionkella sp.]MDZ4393154.1 thioredoxin domain-containing protein [Cypionkella sp.]